MPYTNRLFSIWKINLSYLKVTAALKVLLIRLKMFVFIVHRLHILLQKTNKTNSM